MTLRALVCRSNDAQFMGPSKVCMVNEGREMTLADRSGILGMEGTIFGTLTERL